MARTKNVTGAKMSARKHTKLAAKFKKAGSAKSRTKSSGRGNPACAQKTPDWQKPITKFYKAKPQSVEEKESQPGCSKDMGEAEEVEEKKNDGKELEEKGRKEEGKGEEQDEGDSEELESDGQEQEDEDDGEADDESETD